eukprot:9978081-Lingulodinium_polyedra.AAC.1
MKNARRAQTLPSLRRFVRLRTPRTGRADSRKHMRNWHRASAPRTRRRRPRGTTRNANANA